MPFVLVSLLDVFVLFVSVRFPCYVVMYISRFIVVDKDTYIHWQRMTKNDVIVRRNPVTDHGSQSPDCVTALVEGECSIIIELLVIILLCVYVCMYVCIYVCVFVYMYV